MHHGETPDRAGAEDQQRQTGDQGGHVGIENGAEGAFVAGVDRRLRRGAIAHLFADALVDQHVGVDGHAQGERDGGDAGQRQRRLQQRQDRHQQQQVGRERQHRYHAEHHVVHAHERGDRDKAPERGTETLADVVGAEAGADGALLDDFHRRGEGPGAQQQRHVGRFGGAHAPADLHAPAADLAADHRRGDDLALAFFDQQDGHALADALARHVLENARPRPIQGKVHRRFLRLAVESGLGIGEPVAGQHHLLFHQQRRAAALGIEFGAERHLALLGREQGGGIAVFLVDHADFQGRGAAQNFLGFGRVLHPRQLHHHAVGALLLNDRLGHAQFIDAVLQRGDVLLQRRLLRALDRFRLDRAGQAEFAAREILLGEYQIRLVALQQRARLGAGVGVAELDHKGAAFTADAGMAQGLVAQLGSAIPAQVLQPLGQRGLHVHLQHEVHAAAQVQPKVHGQGVDGGEPVGRGREQVEGDDVGRVVAVGVELLAEDVFGLQLRIGVGEAHLDAVGIEEGA